ncbi:hypothetical protein F4777DRAFT_459767 [Nemania sp. FL0916]|nr:hypothetical protein F4777DRAFT_459767 [Nemania sp. FL0916]
MASKTTYIPRFLLPQSGAMWRQSAVRSAAFAQKRSLHVETGAVIVRYGSKTAPKRPTAITSAVTSAVARVTMRRTGYTKSPATSKKTPPSAPTKPPSKTAGKSQAQSQAQTQAQAQASKPPPSAPKTPFPSRGPSLEKPAAPKPMAFKAASKPAASESKARAAQPDPSKPIVLEKPERFNPPSHGARLPRNRPKHYGGETTFDERKAQSLRDYPGLPPPTQTWAHWFINSRRLHMTITLGTLAGLAVFTFVQNFKAKSPFADLIPPISEFPAHPIQYLGACVDVVRMHEEYESQQTAEKRRRKVDDIAKRNEYRKAHGLEPANAGFFGLKAADPEPVPVPEERVEAAVAATTPVVEVPEPKLDVKAVEGAAEEPAPEGKRKKWFGIF